MELKKALCRLRSDRGSAILETAIMLPIVLLLTFGFIFFTQAVATRIVLETAAREGARTYAVYNSAAMAEDKVMQELAVGQVDPDDVEIIIEGSSYQRVVTVKMPYSFYVPFAGEYAPVLVGSAVFKLEPNPTFY